MTLLELERTAYISGQTTMADLYARAEDLENLESNLDMSGLEPEDLIAQIDAIQSKAVADNCPDYDAYKQFFDTCFELLNGHYPCPGVTSDYDCNVIYDAIRKGEGTDND